MKREYALSSFQRNEPAATGRTLYGLSFIMRRTLVVRSAVCAVSIKHFVFGAWGCFFFSFPG
jgi:hypothetical protein